MVAYYRLPGVIADVALLLYALLTYASFAALGVTLTLAGIAGFILSIGMAVDANVLILGAPVRNYELVKPCTVQ
jgi:preprotein translocase subunit SecD